MRHWAKQRGFTLTQQGLARAIRHHRDKVFVGQVIPVATEEDVFDALGLEVCLFVCFVLASCFFSEWTTFVFLVRGAWKSRSCQLKIMYKNRKLAQNVTRFFLFLFFCFFGVMKLFMFVRCCFGKRCDSSNDGAQFVQQFVRQAQARRARDRADRSRTAQRRQSGVCRGLCAQAPRWQRALCTRACT